LPDGESPSRLFLLVYGGGSIANKTFGVSGAPLLNQVLLFLRFVNLIPEPLSSPKQANADYQHNKWREEDYGECSPSTGPIGEPLISECKADRADLCIKFRTRHIRVELGVQPISKSIVSQIIIFWMLLSKFGNRQLRFYRCL
jgi:hypothetical protein